MRYDENRLARSRRVEAARADVAKATYAYARGGGCDAVNRANAELAAATYEMANPGCPVETGRDK